MNTKSLSRWLPFVLILLITVFVSPQLGTLLIVSYIGYILWSNRSSLFAQLAVRKYRQGDMDGALKWFAKAEKPGGADATTLLSYALVLLKTGDLDAAERNLERTSEQKLSEHNQKALAAMRGLLTWKRGDPQKAAAELGALAEGFRNTTLFGALGSLYLSAGMPDAALRHNIEARDFDPHNRIIADNLGRSYYESGQIEKAEEIFDELIALQASIPEPYVNKAIILESRGEIEEASRLIDRAQGFPYSHLSYFSPDDIEKIRERIQGTSG